MNANTLAVHLTELCNMRCEYCYLNQDRAKIFNTFNNIQSAINKLKPDELFFYGGEATLAFDLLKQVVLANKGLKYSVEINAKVLKDEHINFFKEHDFRIYISLDGIDEKANAPRKMKQEHIERIKDMFIKNPNITLVISVHNQSSGVAEFVEWIKQNAHKHNTNAFEMYLVVSPQPCELSDEFLANLDFYRQNLGGLSPAKFKPKLRVHVDGTISRSHKRGVDNYNKLSKSCAKCEKVNSCHGRNTFNSMICELDDAGILNQTFICKAGKVL